MNSPSKKIHQLQKIFIRNGILSINNTFIASLRVLNRFFNYIIAYLNILKYKWIVFKNLNVV